MITLVPHSGELGTSAWVLCRTCQHDTSQPGSFAIRAREQHYVDPFTYHHYHEDCAIALVESGDAQLHGLSVAV